MAEDLTGTYEKLLEMPALKKRASSSNHKNQNRVKRHRNGKNHVLVPPPSGLNACTNLACRSTQHKCRTQPNGEEFCKSCSCCICYKYDDSEDLSLWMECTSESGSDDSCGFSCHIRCALNGKHLSQLAGTYSCAWESCDKIYSIIGYWKKLIIGAKDEKTVDGLCDKIFLSYRLLDGTLKFKELHKFTLKLMQLLEKGLKDAVISGTSVEKLPVDIYNEVQQLCSVAIENANKLLNGEPSLIAADKGRGLSDSVGPPEVQTGLRPQASQFDLNIPPIIDLNEEPYEPDTSNRCVLGENFERIVKAVRLMEKGGHITENFWVRFLTWFSLRAGEKHRKIINVFEKVMGDDPSVLANQLTHTFAFVASSSKQD